MTVNVPPTVAVVNTVSCVSVDSAAVNCCNIVGPTTVNTVVVKLVAVMPPGILALPVTVS